MTMMFALYKYQIIIRFFKILILVAREGNEYPRRSSFLYSYPIYYLLDKKLRCS
jgi:hypothetical protein